ncbi:inner membrane protein YpjD [Limnohabitans sp. Hippo4]|jgi:ABC-type uncharacterized transport system permease subunit|uniref:cytochrome C assembly family protein n=1 Tax=Limnohabitans sp. Hippo4 TaxID=1826167 RepID=UPI000D3DC79E|nr:cytochrome c biogenesis protein CcsA [Limnohabitans sp. Hippo4]MBU3722362.1 cytochrome C assembly protein [Limnohabitans sp.]PUE34083.1 cytochrome C assembly protein [Limnohabitans sp. Hippo4]
MILASPSDLAMWLTLLTAIAYAIPAITADRMGPSLARRYLWLAWFLHGATIGIGLLGETPRFGFAPALSVTVWWVLTAYAVESQYFPQLKARWTMAALGSAAVALAWVFPGHALQVTASIWLPLHWALGIASYGMFAAAVIHAALMTSAEIEIRQGNENQSGLPLLTLERLMFRFVMLGFVLLTLTLIAGFAFGEQLYGAAGAHWKWDHKTVFSILSWLTFGALLLGRHQFGWRGRRAVRVLYSGAALLLLAYAGSRFVLEVVLGRSL